MSTIIRDRVQVLPHYYNDTLHSSVKLSITDNLINRATGVSVSFDIKFNEAHHNDTAHYGNILQMTPDARLLFSGQIQDNRDDAHRTFTSTVYNTDLSCKLTNETATDPYKITTHDDQWQYITISFNPDGSIVLYKNGVWAVRYAADLNITGVDIHEICMYAIDQAVGDGLLIFYTGNTKLREPETDSDHYIMKNVYVDMAMDDTDAENIYHFVHPKHGNLYYGIKAIIAEYKRRQVMYNRFRFAKRKHFDMLMGTVDNPGSIRYVVHNQAEYGKYNDEMNIKEALDKLHKQWGVTINNQLYGIESIDGRDLGTHVMNTAISTLKAEEGRLGYLCQTYGESSKSSVGSNLADIKDVITLVRKLHITTGVMNTLYYGRKQYVCIGNPGLFNVPGWEDNGEIIGLVLFSESDVYNSKTKYNKIYEFVSGVKDQFSGRIKIGENIYYVNYFFNQFSPYSDDRFYGGSGANYKGMYNGTTFLESVD